jgi:hypothetical protein
MVELGHYIEGAVWWEVIISTRLSVTRGWETQMRVQSR